MLAKSILRAVLLVIVLGCVAIWANRQYNRSHHPATTGPEATDTIPQISGRQVVMTYFITGERCPMCRKIEALARETAEREFPAELTASRLVFRVINTDEPAHAHFVTDYRLKSKTVVLSQRQDGRETSWQTLDKVWDLLDEPPAFRAYLAAGIRTQLRP